MCRNKYVGTYAVGTNSKVAELVTQLFTDGVQK